MLKSRNLLQFMLRWKSTKSNKKQNIDRALDNFDGFYGAVFGIRWKNIRAALLTEHKYVAVVNNFGDVETTCTQLELNGAINMKSLVENQVENMAKSDVIHSVKCATDLETVINDHTHAQELKEMESLYPACIDQTNASHHNQINIAQVNNSIPSYDATLPMVKQSPTEKVNIDEKRLVDPKGNLGGLYEFVPANKIKGMEDWIPESDYYRYYQTQTDFPLKFELESTFTYPKNLLLYTYEMGNCSTFKQPRRGLTKVLSHYLLDGSSVLAPLFLGVQEGDRIIDVCAAPGGKSLLMLQTLSPNQLVCNDVMESRVNRLRGVMQDYLIDYNTRWEGKLVILQQSDARYLEEYGTYDKVLTDVPCTTDRHSVIENNNNIFKPTRIKERLRLPQLQADILANSMRLLKKGGSLVYSTCTLSPVQNDGVVHMALQKVFNEFNLTFTIKDLSQLIHLFSDIYRFEHPKGLKYGQIVLPNLTANFGPMYICKMTRDE